jgi:hypothetical protein
VTPPNKKPSPIRMGEGRVRAGFLRVAGALRFAEAPERWLLGSGGRQKNLNRRAIEESPLRLTIGLPLESEADVSQDLFLAHVLV